ncbi:hypothetical protein [Candidatus Villigracilis affinis]|uniref:hypothetical protein n=1 Tax=Candidatus Villigracilis affinis TaxID=3140682 RepID=UPI001DC66F0B|nr:hypothetical protein [Anaerolineales bacterium]
MNNSVKITVVGPKEKHWQITEIEFENAERLETIFDKYAQRIIDPPVDSKNCMSKVLSPVLHRHWDSAQIPSVFYTLAFFQPDGFVKIRSEAKFGLLSK